MEPPFSCSASVPILGITITFAPTLRFPAPDAIAFASEWYCDATTDRFVASPVFFVLCPT